MRTGFNLQKLLTYFAEHGMIPIAAVVPQKRRSGGPALTSSAGKEVNGFCSVPDRHGQVCGCRFGSRFLFVYFVS